MGNLPAYPPSKMMTKQIFFYFQDEISYMASCLRQVNATEMVNAEWDGIVYGIMGCPFTPVYDGVFFPDTPGKALQRKNFKKASILLGTNSNEGNYFIIYYLTEIFKREVREHS